MAGTTRLELATFGVTGRRSNQLNYAPVSFDKVRVGLNAVNGWPRLWPDSLFLTAGARRA